MRKWRYNTIRRAVHVISHGPGQRSRYTDSLRARRSGDRMPMGAIFSAPVKTHPDYCKIGMGVSFPVVKRPARGVDHTPPPRAEVKGRVKQYLYSPSMPSWPVLG